MTNCTCERKAVYWCDACWQRNSSPRPTKEERNAYFAEWERNVERATMNEYELDAIGAEALIGQSHMPDLTQRLIETHQTLQLSRSYLMERTATDDHNGIRTIDHIFDAMGHIEQAIKALSTN